MAGARSRRSCNPTLASVAFRCGDDVGRPGVHRLRPIDRQDRLAVERRPRSRHLVRCFPDVCRRVAGREQRLHDLRAPDVARALGDPPEAVAHHPQVAFHGDRAEALGQLELEGRNDRHLVLANATRRIGHVRAGGLAHRHQQVHGDAGPGAQLLERLVGERGEQAVRGIVDEVEREVAASQRTRQGLERDGCRHHAVDDAHAPDVTVGEPAIGVGLEDPQLDEVTQFLDA